MREYFHSVVLNDEKCIGCTNCMRRCPTEAIRVRNKKAVITKERCIDCGECIRVCPSHAQNSVTDDLSRLKEFKFNIAIPSISLYGQFNSSVDMDRVYEGIREIGFDCVFDEGIAADILTNVIKHMINRKDIRKPIISSMCPAILRLIQVKFPSLIENIVNVESPMEIAGRLAREAAERQYGYKSEEIGVFCLASCPAKVTSIMKPIGIEKSSLNGAIAINKIYGPVVEKMKRIESCNHYEKGTVNGISWATVGGQSKSIGIDNYIAVDGIENVIGVLEKMELGKLDSVVYFEGLACMGGCVGGPLNVENPFIAKSIIERLSYYTGYNVTATKYTDEDYIKKILEDGIINWTNKIKQKGILNLDEDINRAMEKLARMKRIENALPGLDCGSCGAPTCHALAEDTIRGFAQVKDCIFIKDLKKLNDDGGEI